jgi:hypothetical protein
VRRHGSAGADVATTRGDPGLGGCSEDRADRAHRMTRHGAHGHLGPGVEDVERREGIGPELAGRDRQGLGGVRPVAPDVDREAVEPRGVQEHRHRQQSIPGRLPAVDERDPRSGRTVAGGDEPARQGQVAGRDLDGLERQAEVGRVDLRRPRDRVARADAVEEREPVGEGERARRRSLRRRPPGGGSARPYGTAHRRRLSSVRPPSTDRRPVVAPVRRLVSPPISSTGGEARSVRRPRGRARSDPDPDQGRLAAAGATAPSGPHRRRPGASRVATRLMAEINEAYAALTRPGTKPAPRWRQAADADGDADGRTAGSAAGTKRGGPPRPRPARPVTGRVDTTETFRPRNQPLRSAGTGSRGSASGLPGQPPYRDARGRAGAAAGEHADRAARPIPAPQLPRRPPDPPPRRGARGRAQCSASSTATRWDRSRRSSRPTSTGSPRRSPATRDLVAAARVVRDDLDRRGRGSGGHGPRRRPSGAADRVARAPRRAALEGHETIASGYPERRSVRWRRRNLRAMSFCRIAAWCLLADDPLVTRVVTWVRDPRRSNRHGETKGRSLIRVRRPRCSQVVVALRHVDKLLPFRGIASMGDPSRLGRGNGRAPCGHHSGTAGTQVPGGTIAVRRGALLRAAAR